MAGDAFYDATQIKNICSRVAGHDPCVLYNPAQTPVITRTEICTPGYLNSDPHISNHKEVKVNLNISLDVCNIYTLYNRKVQPMNPSSSILVQQVSQK